MLIVRGGGAMSDMSKVFALMEQFNRRVCRVVYGNVNDDEAGVFLRNLELVSSGSWFKC